MEKHIQIPVLRLMQWLEAWDGYGFDPGTQRRRPNPDMYMFSMPAGKLCDYCDVYSRERNTEGAEGIQRGRNVNRTERIRRYVEAGYPFSELKQGLRETHTHLKRPGWLPTAIVVNLLKQDDQRSGKRIKEQHAASMLEDCGRHSIRLPEQDSFDEGDLRPLEVIDGQHRLWAFSGDENLSGFEVPVVAFHGLDIAWQAYLFWTINIAPVRINPSHAFDLFPLLRTQDWLMETGEITVYREARAQEITEWVYLHPSSPWYNRISMLQRKGMARVSQAAWIRSLIRSFFSFGGGKGRNGLFQSALNGSHASLDWERSQQIAFILEFWHIMREELSRSEEDWVKLYRNADKDPYTDRTSMLNQDMGVNSAHAALNDIFFRNAEEWRLCDWRFESADKTITTAEGIQNAIDSLRENNLHKRLKEVACAMSTFDWRSLDGPGVRSSEHEMTKRAYRGSGGYALLTDRILDHVALNGESVAADGAGQMLPT